MARGFARGLHFVLEYRNTHVQGRMAGGMPAHTKRQSERNPESSSRLVIVGIGQFARVKLRLEPKVPGTGKLPFSRRLEILADQFSWRAAKV